jgi:hypothetical protein
MQILQKSAEIIKKNLSLAIATEQIVRPAALDCSLIECFNIGWAAPAFDVLRHSLMFSEVMALMRLWDDRGDVNSLPSVASRFRDATLIEALVERERVATEDVRRVEWFMGEGDQLSEFPATRRTADQREGDLKGRISLWLKDFKSAKGSSEITRLRKFRDELAAHSATRSRKPKVKQMLYGDIRQALYRIIPIASGAYHISTGVFHDFDLSETVWEERQTHMWSVVRAATRGERFSPPPMAAENLLQEMNRLEIKKLTIKG